MFFEQKIMKEIVGSQDQLATAVGGFNKIIFNKKKNYKFHSINKVKNLYNLENNLLLIYSGSKRTAQKIANTYVKKLTTTNKFFIRNMIDHVNEGEKILKKGNIDDFGKLLHSAWQIKKKLSSSVSNSKIDNLYELAIKYGALGGKILGAGGGGFFLFYMKKELQKNFLDNNKKIINVPFKFTNMGTEIIYKDLKR